MATAVAVGAAGSKGIKSKDKTICLMEINRDTRARIRQMQGATAGFQAIMPAVELAMNRLALACDTAEGFQGMIGGMTEENLDIINAAMSSNNAEHKILTLAKAYFEQQYADLAMAKAEILSAEQALCMAMEKNVIKHFFSEGAYQMANISKCISLAYKAKGREMDV